MYGFGQAPPAPFPYVNPPSRTQAVYEPDPNTDNVRIALPPNQWVTGPTHIKVSSPSNALRAGGPFPNDRQLARTRPYMPLHRGWVESNGEYVYTLQGPEGLGQDDADRTAIRWSIAASVISAIALATTTLIAVLRYREEKGR